MSLERKTGLAKAVIFFAVTTFIFAVLGFFNIENWLLRIFTQGSLCLMVLFKGIYTIKQQKERKNVGYLFIGAAAFTFFVMVNTIMVGFEVGVF